MDENCVKFSSLDPKFSWEMEEKVGHKEKKKKDRSASLSVHLSMHLEKEKWRERLFLSHDSVIPKVSRASFPGAKHSSM